MTCVQLSAASAHRRAHHHAAASRPSNSETSQDFPSGIGDDDLPAFTDPDPRLGDHDQRTFSFDLHVEPSRSATILVSQFLSLCVRYPMEAFSQRALAALCPEHDHLVPHFRHDAGACLSHLPQLRRLEPVGQRQPAVDHDRGPRDIGRDPVRQHRQRHRGEVFAAAERPSGMCLASDGSATKPPAAMAPGTSALTRMPKRPKVFASSRTSIAMRRLRRRVMRQIARRAGMQRGQQQERAGLLAPRSIVAPVRAKMKAGVEIDRMHLPPGLAHRPQTHDRPRAAAARRCARNASPAQRAFSAAASSASQASRVARSPTQGTASSGRGDAAIAAVTVSSRKSANTVRTPSPTSACAIARPMPLPAPVTSAASRAGSNGCCSRLMAMNLRREHDRHTIARQRRLHRHHRGPARRRNRTLFSPHFSGTRTGRMNGGTHMKTPITIVASALLALALSPASSMAIAGERPGDAALGALSGALVLGPIGAVAGAVVGYSAGPSISHSLGFRRSTAARRTSTRREARASSGNRQLASGNQPAVQAASPTPPPAATKTTSTAPPVQGLE